MRILCFVIFLELSLLATSIVNVSMTTDKPEYSFDTISQVKSFQSTSLPIKINAKQSYWVKVDINSSLLDAQERFILNLETYVGRIDYIYNPKYVSSANNKELIYLNESKRTSYYFKLIDRDALIIFNAKVQKLQDYTSLSLLRQSLYGISYGVILSAILYYFSFFIFIKNRTYFYYSVTQFLMLLVLILVTIKSQNSDDYLLFAVLYSLFILFTSLFANAFLELKRHSLWLFRALFFITILLILEVYFDISSRFAVPVAPFMLIYLVSALHVYMKTKDRAILFYLFGWTVLISSFVIAEIQILFFSQMSIKPTDILHVSMPLESLILAFALSYKMKQLKEEQKVKEQLLVHQDKRASIGDMIDNIAHQWRQPLTNIAYIVMNISAASRNEKLNATLWEKKSQEINNQLKYMSETINDFRSFYAQNGERKLFNVNEALQTMHNIVSATLSSENISLVVQGNESLQLNGSKSEFTQVLLNLITNAKEAFMQRGAKGAKITITLLDDAIWIEDNAGGVEESLRDTLFESHISTKTEGGGVGLYMSKLIIEKHFNATLEYQAIEYGSRFIVKLL